MDESGRIRAIEEQKRGGNGMKYEKPSLSIVMMEEDVIRTSELDPDGKPWEDGGDFFPKQP